MKRFDRAVTTSELREAPAITKMDFAVCARSLAIALAVKISPPDCFIIIREITPNARLRQLLDHVRTQVEHGKSFDDAFASHAEVDVSLLGAIHYGEMEDYVPGSLFQYVRMSGVKIHQIREHIGRLPVVHEFTEQMAEQLASDRPILRCLRTIIPCSEEDFRPVLIDIMSHIEGGAMLHEALAYHPAIFDPFYIAMVKAGKDTGKMERVFFLLSQL